MEAITMDAGEMSQFTKEIVEPEDSYKILPSLEEPYWVYRYKDEENGWLLSVATRAEAGSFNHSLGGFRIAPEDRVSIPNYSNDHEALSLGRGMEAKVDWSRIIGAGGPVGKQAIHKVVGGKCVLFPTADARVGKPRDFEILNFAATCLNDFEKSTNILPTTGQDLGHGVMSDGKTSSLEYMYERYIGWTNADTSIPTGEGNFHFLVGALRAHDIDPSKARVGLIGCGNVGRRIFENLQKIGTDISVVDISELVEQKMKKEGVPFWKPEGLNEFLKQPLDAIVINANGSTLCDETVEAITANNAIRIICGSENLAMPNPDNEIKLREASQIYCPTEFCGMMGFLTAVEQNISRRNGKDFMLESMIEPCKVLDEAAYKGIGRVLKDDYKLSFSDAIRAEYK